MLADSDIDKPRAAGDDLLLQGKDSLVLSGLPQALALAEEKLLGGR